MFTALLIASLMAPSAAVPTSATMEELQADFETAVACKQIDGRKVWKGQLAYYIQSYVYEDQAAASEEVADAVMPEDNTEETVTEFEKACAAADLAGSRAQSEHQ